jgi:hypothetical protein
MTIRALQPHGRTKKQGYSFGLQGKLTYAGSIPVGSANIIFDKTDEFHYLPVNLCQFWTMCVGRNSAKGGDMLARPTNLEGNILKLNRHNTS